jgi:hypothetical protein
MGGGVRLFNVRDYGAVGDGTTDDTAAIQAAIDAAGAAGGGVIVVPMSDQPYILKPAGVNIYTTLEGHQYCLDLNADNLTLRIDTGAILKLGDGSQTDAAGPVDMIVWKNRSNITVEGGGRITGNTAGQPGWTGGYAQVNNGLIISSYGTNNLITVCNLTLDDHFSNPVSLDNTLTNVVMRNLTTSDCGEGLIVSRTTGLVVDRCTYTDTTGVTVGDGIEIQGCNSWLCIDCTVNLGALAGSSIDLTGSQYGTLQDFTIDGGISGVAIQGMTTRAITNVTVKNGTIQNLLNGGTGVYIQNEDHPTTEMNVTVDNLTISPLNAGEANGFQIAAYSAKCAGPVTIENCTLNNLGNGFIIKTIRDLTITLCAFNTCGNGIWWRGGDNADTQDDVSGLVFSNLIFIASSAADISVNNSGTITGPVGEITDCTWNATWNKRVGFGGDTMLDMEVSGSNPDTLSYGNLWPYIPLWIYDYIQPFNGRTWYGLPQGTLNQTIEFQFSDGSTFVDKDEEGGTNLDLTTPTFVGGAGKTLTLGWDRDTLLWSEISREE